MRFSGPDWVAIILAVTVLTVALAIVVAGAVTGRPLGEVSGKVAIEVLGPIVVGLSGYIAYRAANRKDNDP